MQFASTRDANLRVPFDEALLAGLAPDGGLFLPESIPTLPTDPSSESYPVLASQILAPYVDGVISPAALGGMCADAYDFPVPLVDLGDGIHIMELFHGPTLSFKDFGARAMARAMNLILEGADQKVTILVATSGDTGSAVADAYAGVDSCRVVLLFPSGQVSPVQEMQLTAKREGVLSLKVSGTFDDCQRMVKEAFTTGIDGHRLSSANSINIGRLLPQSVYYTWAWLQIGRSEAVYCVPSGNLGNITGGHLARASGAGIRRLIAGHNDNRFFTDYLSTGSAEERPSLRTVSNAMDVGSPSNFERLSGLMTLGEIQAGFWGTNVNDADTIASIRQTRQDYGYTADPHTAVGIEAIRRYREETGDETPAVILSTAHPCKFPETVHHATGHDVPSHPQLDLIRELPSAYEAIEPTLDSLRSAVSEWDES